jgi:hypothetical protein
MTRLLDRCTPFMLAGVMLALPAAGCGKAKPPTAPVAGRVLLDGKPVSDAAVMFEPLDGGVPARGSTGADGSFSLSTFARDDGALLGRHRVSISKFVTEGVAANELGLEAAPGAPGLQPKAALPPRYADPKSSGLKATVEAAGTRAEFSLTSKD